MCAVLPVVGGRNERNDAMSKEYRAGDRAFAKVGRNLVEVRVKAKAENGWTVETRNGKTLTVKSLESQGGESATTAAPKAAKSRATKPAVTSPEKGLSLLNAAAAVLEQSDEPLAVRVPETVSTEYTAVSKYSFSGSSTGYTKSIKLLDL